MSEAGEVGEMYEDAEMYDQQRTSSFAAFAPPQTRTSLPFQEEEEEQDRRSSSPASPRSIDRERWAEERESSRRQTVATSQSGSVYPGDEEDGEGRDSTYSLNESYFALDPGEGRRDSRRETMTPPARGASRSDAPKSESCSFLSLLVE